ncbi:hypothetical protein, conserved [Eimeria acervulina]|uniref:Uncharacterized protein n=1 Tax=Eimeria acervulina TaxID=5801 RepID=U6GFC7_EIMAC|nr:hypothetical protein, conserved [Eimeria acervulina]CDI78885.1 hypothetical protein, conserved [Eimeria acervulina]
MLLFGRRSGGGHDSASDGTCGRSCSGSSSSSTSTEPDSNGGNRNNRGSGNSNDSSSINDDSSSINDDSSNNNANSSTNVTDSSNSTDTQGTSSATQRTPEELQKRATAMREAMDTCSGLKEQYDRCFNHWYRRHFLRGDMSRNCFHLFADYRLCISEELKRKGLE